MYGAALPRGERGQIGAGLGQTLSTGVVGLVPPTADITRTGQTETVDGIRMVFQLTPGTEAPAGPGASHKSGVTSSELAL